MKLNKYIQINCLLFCFIYFSCSVEKPLIYLRNLTTDTLTIEYIPYDAYYLDSLLSKKISHKFAKQNINNKNMMLFNKPIGCANCQVSLFKNSIVKIILPQNDSVSITSLDYSEVPAVWILIGDVVLKDKSNRLYNSELDLLSKIYQIPNETCYSINIDSSLIQSESNDDLELIKLKFNDYYSFSVEKLKNDTIKVCTFKIIKDNSGLYSNNIPVACEYYLKRKWIRTELLY